jgi:FSR family fosmidomycin resistance protein-like MFS transporter
MAAGRRKGFAQSFFQVGGNTGSAVGPLLAALIVVPNSQKSLVIFSEIALIGVIVLFRVGKWQSRNGHLIQRKPKVGAVHSVWIHPRKTIVRAMTVLVALTFLKYVYLTSLTSYYTFYLIDRFHVTKQDSVLYLFLLLLASAFSAILGYAQELMPGKVGMVAGLFFGIAFGIAGIGSAVLGKIAGSTCINFVFQICAFLPPLGLLTVFLPDIEGHQEEAY